MKRTLLGLTLAASLALPLRAADLDPDLRQERHQFAATLKIPVAYEYLVHYPDGFDAKKRWPLIFFLHGADERGDELAKVAVHGPPQLVTRAPRARKGETEAQKAAKQEAIRLLKENFLIVSPQCPKGEIWEERRVSALLDHVEKQLPVDDRRIYLTGLSMGGYGTWELGLRQPGRFAALAPICGGLNSITPLLNRHDPARRAAQNRLPIWIFHGGKDTVVLPEESHRAKKLLEKLGHENVKLTIHPDAGHDSWTASYANPELYRWFLSHASK